MRFRPRFAEAGARFSYATLRRKASIRLTTLVREGAFGGADFYLNRAKLIEGPLIDDVQD